MKQIGVKDAFERMQNNEIVILDVREQFEVDVASVEKFIHIPMQQVPQRLDELPKDKTIGVLCHTGSRSARVTQFLKQRGFDDTVNITGGIEDWSTKTESDTPRYTKSFGRAQVVS